MGFKLPILDKIPIPRSVVGRWVIDPHSHDSRDFRLAHGPGVRVAQGKALVLDLQLTP